MEQTEIAELLGVNHATVSQWMRKFNLQTDVGRYARNQPDLEPSKDLFYIIGVVHGDGVIYQNSTNSWIIQLQCTNKTFADSFRRSLNKLGLHTRFYEFERNSSIYYQVRGYSKLLCEFIRDKEPKTLLTEAEYKNSFIRGIYESDGSISIYRKDSPRLSVVWSSDIQVVRLIESLLIEMGYEFSRYSRENTGFTDEEAYEVRLTGGKSAVKRFFDEVNPVVKRWDK